MKTTKDNYVWLLVTDKAKEVFQSGLFEMCILHDDDSETLIEDISQLSEALEDGLDIGIPVGYFNQNEL